MWKNIVERGRPHMATWHMRIAGYKNTHSGCIILIAFPLQQLLQERASVLRHTYTACLVEVYLGSSGIGARSTVSLLLCP